MGWTPDPQRVHELLAASGCLWPAPIYVESTGSTNADVLALASPGALDGTCVVAGEQTAGRGRHGRDWISDSGVGLWSSTLVRSTDRLARLPLLAALAVVDVARDVGAMAWNIKWPNDVLDSSGRKVAGILVEGVGADSGTAVVGIGLNVERPRGSSRRRDRGWGSLAFARTEVRCSPVCWPLCTRACGSRGLRHWPITEVCAPRSVPMSMWCYPAERNSLVGVWA